VSSSIDPFSVRVLDAAAPGFDAELDRLIAFEIAQDDEIERTVSTIIADVRTRGDAALLEYTRRFDRLDVDRAESLEIPRSEMVAPSKALRRRIATR
jgi:histidinol dehydrogenase